MKTLSSYLVNKGEPTRLSMKSHSAKIGGCKFFCINEIFISVSLQISRRRLGQTVMP